MSKCAMPECNREAFSKLTICEDCFERAATSSAMNMGAAEIFICYDCGESYLPEEYIGHVCIHLAEEV
jgi:hypothetical protein